MNKLVSFFVKRYLRFDREQPFISLSAILAFIGIALGVMVLIIAMAIMNGFDKEFERKLKLHNVKFEFSQKLLRDIIKHMMAIETNGELVY